TLPSKAIRDTFGLSQLYHLRQGKILAHRLPHERLLANGASSCDRYQASLRSLRRRFRRERWRMLAHAWLAEAAPVPQMFDMATFMPQVARHAERYLTID